MQTAIETYYTDGQAYAGDQTRLKAIEAAAAPARRRPSHRRGRTTKLSRRRRRATSSSSRSPPTARSPAVHGDRQGRLPHHGPGRRPIPTIAKRALRARFLVPAGTLGRFRPASSCRQAACDRERPSAHSAPPPPPQHGFTLVEVLAASFILMVGVVAVFGLINASNGAARRARARDAAPTSPES